MLALALVIAAAIPTAHVEPVTTCQTVAAEAIADPEVPSLLAHGWWSDPRDGAEMLYSPGCDAFPLGENVTWSGASVTHAVMRVAVAVTTSWQPAPTDWTEGRTGCMAHIDDTTVIVCPDGWTITS